MIIKVVTKNDKKVISTKDLPQTTYISSAFRTTGGDIYSLVRSVNGTEYTAVFKCITDMRALRDVANIVNNDPIVACDASVKEAVSLGFDVYIFENIDDFIDFVNCSN